MKIKKQTLASRYNSSKHSLPKYAGGGALDIAAQNKAGLSSTIGLAGSIGGGLIDAFGQSETKVGSALSSGLSMAASGAAIGGPIGAIAGGALGLATGWISGARQQKIQREQDRLNAGRKTQASLDAGQAAIANDPTILTGNKDAEYFANGGSIHINPANKGKFTASANAAGMGVQEFANHVLADKDEYSSTQVKRANFAHNAAGWKKENGGSLSSRYYKANGGELGEINSSTVEVEGNTHAEGGVQIPGAEVEDGETISNGFVFSDKLGFAQQHKPIAKAIGKIEKKVNSPARTNTLELLEKKEQALALSQEFFKQQMGIPSELDNMTNG